MSERSSRYRPFIVDEQLGQYEYEKSQPSIQSLWESYTELMVASVNGELSTVTHLVENEHVNINEKSGWNKTTALILAAAANQFEVVKYLISQNSIGIDDQNALGNSALMVAAEEGHIKIVDLLATSGASIAVKNVYEQTALILAIESNNLEIVKVVFFIGKHDKHGCIFKHGFILMFFHSGSRSMLWLIILLKIN